MEALLVAALPCRKGASPMTVLRQRMTQDMQVRNLSRHTQASYLQQVSLFARHFGKSPDALTPEHIRTYQIYLTNEKKLAAGSIHIAVAALRFLYKITLKREWTFADVLPLPKKPQKLPVGRSGCFRVLIQVSRSREKPSKTPAKRHIDSPAYPNLSHRIRYATPLRYICSSLALTSGPFSCCLVIAAWLPPPSTCG